jgi:hypothetical protein
VSGDGIAYRLRILGIEESFVTDRRLAGATGVAPNHVNLPGLMRDSLRLDESVALPQMEYDSRGFSVEIVERQHDNAVAKALFRVPTLKLYVSSAAGDSIAPATTTVPVTAGGTQYADGDYLWMGKECMKVNGTPSATSITVLRGQLGTTAHRHYRITRDSTEIPLVLYNRPPTLEGRRVELYQYIEGRDTFAPSAAGTLIWRGVALTGALPSDGTTWSFKVESVTSLWAQSLGSDLDELASVRGIYYPTAAPLWVRIAELDGGTLHEAKRFFTGFWETQDKFAADLTSELATMLTASGAPSISGVEARASGDQWTIEATSTSTGVWSVTAASLVDGFGQAADDGTGGAGTYAANWKGGMEGARTVPRAVFGTSTRAGDPAQLADAGIEQGDWGQLSGATAVHLQGDASANRTASDILFVNEYVEDLEGVDIEWEDSDRPLSYDIVSSNATDRFYQLRRSSRLLGILMRGARRIVTSASLPEIRAKRVIAVGTLADFRDELISQAPELAGAGAMPMFTASDFGDWQDPISEIALEAPILNGRTYAVTSSVTLLDILTQEFRLHRVFPYQDENGAIRLRQLRIPGAGVAPDVELGPADIATKEQWPAIEEIGFGSFNAVTYLTGYDLFEEEHRGRTIKIRAQKGTPEKEWFRTLEIAPLSLDPVAVQPDTDTFLNLAQPIVDTFGDTYHVATVPVLARRVSDLQLGNVVALTTDHLVDPVTGDRGVVGLVGLIVSRSFDLHEAWGTIKVMLFGERAAGICPCVHITSATSLGSNQWEIGVTTMDPFNVFDMFPPGPSIGLYFPWGYRISLIRVDHNANFTAAGTVLEAGHAVDGRTGTMRIQMDTSLSVSTNDYVMTYAAATDTQLHVDQRRFLYTANTSERVAFDGTPTNEVNARTFGP